MTAKEICRKYDESADKVEMIQVLADMEVCTKQDIIELLESNGRAIPFKRKRGRKPKAKEEPAVKVVHKPVPDAVIATCYSRLDQIDSMIRELQTEYREITEFLKENGNESA